MLANLKHTAAPNAFRHRPIQGAAGLVAKSFTGLVDLPGLRDSARTIRDMGVALKAPQRNDEDARELMSRIDRVVARTKSPAAVTVEHIGRVDEGVFIDDVGEVQSLINDVYTVKAELTRIKEENYTKKFTCQRDIHQFIAERKQEVLDHLLEFCVDGTTQSLRLKQKLEGLDATLAQINTRIAALERINSPIEPRRSAVFECVAITYGKLQSNIPQPFFF